MRRRKHGGARPGAGRPRKAPGESAAELRIAVYVHVTPEQHAELGRAAAPQPVSTWMRGIALDAARRGESVVGGGALCQRFSCVDGDRTCGVRHTEREAAVGHAARLSRRDGAAWIVRPLNDEARASERMDAVADAERAARRDRS